MVPLYGVAAPRVEQQLQRQAQVSCKSPDGYGDCAFTIIVVVLHCRKTSASSRVEQQLQRQTQVRCSPSDGCSDYTLSNQRGPGLGFTTVLERIYGEYSCQSSHCIVVLLILLLTSCCREISAAQDRFTSVLERIYGEWERERELVRMVMMTVGRGGQGDVGQRIRDEILVVQVRCSTVWFASRNAADHPKNCPATVTASLQVPSSNCLVPTALLQLPCCDCLVTIALMRLPCCDGSVTTTARAG